MVPFTHDVLLVGHGIAGAVLASTLNARGYRVHVFDRERAGSASRVAAGVVNPIAFRRDVLTWRANEILPVANEFYSSREAALNTRFWHPLHLVKVFPEPYGSVQWERAMANATTKDLLTREPQPSVDGNEALSMPHGHGTVRSSAWLDVTTFLDAHRQWLLDRGALTERAIEEKDIVDQRDGVCIGDLSAPWLVRAMGPFDVMEGLVPVQGELLTVRIPGLGIDRMMHRGVFLLPIGDDLYKLGATFRWTDVWSGPSKEARNWLVERAQEFVKIPMEVIHHQVGVRPAARDRRPLLGVTKPHVAVFNGLGSRGVLLAPWCAEHFIDHLFRCEPLDPEVDIRRWG